MFSEWLYSLKAMRSKKDFLYETPQILEEFDFLLNVEKWRNRSSSFRT